MEGKLDKLHREEKRRKGSRREEKIIMEGIWKGSKINHVERRSE